MTIFSMVVVIMLYIWQLWRLMGSGGVAVYGVIMYVNFIFIAIFLGYSMGSAPIVSYHYGAENYDELKNIFRGRIKEYAEKYPSATYYPGERPWGVKCDIAMPCATQNELDGEDAKRLLANGVKVVAEVSNMGCRPEAIDAFIAAKIPYGPGKAVNAGGVATAGLEMTQNSQKLNWTAEEVDAKLHQIMSSIHHACVEYGTEKDVYLNYMKCANIAGFMKVAKSMVEQGVI